MLIWLDMANSPHPVLFRAVSAELIARGHRLLVTTRDHGQTKELTLQAWPTAYVAGNESPAARGSKARALGARAFALHRYVAGAGVDVAVSLNSYAQIAAARLGGIPTATLMDYEYQVANHLSFRLADRVVVPEVFPSEQLRRFGARDRRIHRFCGFKEEIYIDRPLGGDTLSRFPARDQARAIFRPPAEGSMYHRGANETFDRLVAHAASHENVDVLVLPRLAHQRDRYAALPRVRVADRALDGLTALRLADVFVGGGGTMTREAALLGVRTYTMFRGRRPAVDEALIDDGRMKDLRTVRLGAVDWSPRSRPEVERSDRRLRDRGQLLRSWFADVIEGTASQRRL